LNGQPPSDSADGSAAHQHGTTFAEQLKLPAANAVQAAVRSLHSSPPYSGAATPYGPDEEAKHIETAGCGMWQIVTIWNEMETHGTIEIAAKDNKVLEERQIVQRRAYNALVKVLGDFIKGLPQLKEVPSGTIDLLRSIFEDLNSEVVNSMRKELHPSNYMYTALTHLVLQTHPDFYKCTIYLERVKIAFDMVNQCSQAFVKLTH
jgi:hypothetical protein